MKKDKVYKIKTGITVNTDLIELMDEYLVFFFKTIDTRK